MTPMTEKRLLQVAVALGGAFSLFFAGTSVIEGMRVLTVGDPRLDIDLDSHFRYLSGIFLGAILALYSCIPAIERKGSRFRLVGVLIVCGGLARLLGLLINGVPGNGHLYGLAMELFVTPMLLLWQARVARRFTAAD
ncbi:MAG TPA: DUF4345 domain-containing protein [Sphingomonadaceae bacterium]|nr:DUF4345 domain-containing protein [Sphingomonadaceae bacterium]